MKVVVVANGFIVVLLFDAKQLETAVGDAGFQVIETGYHGKNKVARFIVARRPD